MSKCELCELGSPRHPWEDVVRGKCPDCGACMGTLFFTHDNGGYEYKVEPHSRMGNKSYYDDVEVGEYCSCGHERRWARRR